MSAQVTDSSQGAQNEARLGVSQTILRAAVGTFAGALASFFPRLMSILGGNPTQKVEIFSNEYLIAGAIVAIIVGVLVVIIDGDPGRKVRDVFMTALGIPTLLVGALSTGATGNNIAQAQGELLRTTDELRRQADIPIERKGGENVPALAPLSALQIQDFLIAPALAQTELSKPASNQNKIGLAIRQPTYYVIYGSARTQAELTKLQQDAQQAGIAAKVVPGTKSEYFLVPTDGAVKSYADAVVTASKAKKEFGAKPYLLPYTAAEP